MILFRHYPWTVTGNNYANININKRKLQKNLKLTMFQDGLHLGGCLSYLKTDSVNLQNSKF